MLKTIALTTAVAVALLVGPPLRILGPGSALANTDHPMRATVETTGLTPASRAGVVTRHHIRTRSAHHRGHRFAHRLAHRVAHHHLANFARRHLAAHATNPVRRPIEQRSLLAVARHYIGHGRVTHQRGPWCRDFVNTVLRRAGYRLTNTSRRAIDALSLGHRVSSPRPGDLVVMRHHVTIFAGYGGRGLIGLGGNQGRGGVNYASFGRHRVVAFVRP